MGELNEKWSVNEPLQKQVDIIVKSIIENYEKMSPYILREFNDGVEDTFEKKSHIYLDEIPDLDTDVVYFKAINITYVASFVSDLKEYETFLNKSLECSYSNDEITLQMHVAYYKGKLHIRQEITEELLAHELLHCFQKNRDGIKATDIYNYAKILHDESFFNNFVIKNSSKLKFLSGLTFDDVKWIIGSIYFFDKVEVDANAQKLYRECLHIYIGNYSDDNSGMRSAFNFLSRNTSTYKYFLELRNEVSKQIYYASDNLKIFILWLFDGKFKSFDEFSGLMDYEISYAQKKFDKVLWYFITRSSIDNDLVETAVRKMWGSPIDPHELFEASYMMFRLRNEISKDLDNRLEYIKNFVV